MLNTWLRQNGWHFADDIFKCIFFNENVWISIKISLNFVPMGPTNNIPALVRTMAWRRPGDKPLSEPVMVSLLTHMNAWHGLNELIWITKHENVFAFSFIIHHWDCVNSWYPTTWTIGPIYPVKANIPQSIQTSVPQGFDTLDKIPEILHTFLRHFFHIFHFESIFTWFYFHVGLINNNLSVVGEMTWHWTGDKPSLKPLMTQFTVSLSHMSRVCFIFVFWSKL